MKALRIITLVGCAMLVGGGWLAYEKYRQKNAPITTIFAHGLGGSGENMAAYCMHEEPPRTLIIGNTAIFNFTDYEYESIRNSSLGQKKDVQTLKEVAQKYERALLVGVSRGAATIVNFLGTEPSDHIVAAILEAPFDSVEHLIEEKTGFSSLHTVVPYVYPEYDPNGMQPIKHAADINKRVPLLLICSEEDGIIPAAVTINLYNAIKKAGHQKVHLLVVKHGSHGLILRGPDAVLVHDVVQAFYKHYGLPYDEECAAAGEELFVQTQSGGEEKAREDEHHEMNV